MSIRNPQICKSVAQFILTLIKIVVISISSCRLQIYQKWFWINLQSTTRNRYNYNLYQSWNKLSNRFTYLWMSNWQSTTFPAKNIIYNLHILYNLQWKILLVSMVGRAEGQACTDLGARTPISASGNYLDISLISDPILFPFWNFDYFWLICRLLWWIIYKAYEDFNFCPVYTNIQGVSKIPVICLSAVFSAKTPTGR